MNGYPPQRGNPDLITVHPVPLGRGADVAALPIPQETVEPVRQQLPSALAAITGNCHITIGATTARAIPLVPALNGGVLTELSIFSHTAGAHGTTAWMLVGASGTLTTLAEIKSRPRLFPNSVIEGPGDGFASCPPAYTQIILRPNCIIPPGHPLLLFAVNNEAESAVVLCAFATLQLPAP